MLVVETVGRIRREHFVKGKSIKEIARALKVSRNTVRKVLRSGATAFEYSRQVQPWPKLGPWREDFDQMLAANAAQLPRERLAVIRLYEELRGRGYEGGYDSVRRYAKAWRVAGGAATAQAYVPLSLAPGEAYQFDWSHEIGLDPTVVSPAAKLAEGNDYPRRGCNERCVSDPGARGNPGMAVRGFRPG